MGVLYNEIHQYNKNHLYSTLKVREIMTRIKYCLFVVTRTVPVQRDALSVHGAGPSVSRSEAMRHVCCVKYLVQ